MRFEEEFPYLFPLEPSKTGSMDTEILLADSGYGQGEMEMNIVHLAATYTPFINKGNLITPTLLLEDEKAKAWKENVISEEQAALINNMLKKVVEDPQGTAHKAQIDGLPFSRKNRYRRTKSQTRRKRHGKRLVRRL